MNEKKKLRRLPKRILSFVLTMAMMLTLMPGMEAKAETYGGSWGECTWSYDSDSKTLTVSGSSDMPATDDIADRPWNSYASEILNVVIESGVKSIGQYAFNSCTSLTSVTIPNSVTKIYLNTFSGCNNLTEIVIPDSVTEIGAYSFNGCTKLQNVTLSANIQAITGNLFTSCTSLVSITLPTSTTRIVGSAFNGCTELTSISIPASVTSIAAGAFRNCSKLATITFEGSSLPTTLGNNAFSSLPTTGTVTINGNAPDATQIEKLKTAGIPESWFSSGGDDENTINNISIDSSGKLSLGIGENNYTYDVIGNPVAGDGEDASSVPTLNTIGLGYAYDEANQKATLTVIGKDGVAPLIESSSDSAIISCVDLELVLNVDTTVKCTQTANKAAISLKAFGERKNLTISGAHKLTVQREAASGNSPYAIDVNDLNVKAGATLEVNSHATSGDDYSQGIKVYNMLTNEGSIFVDTYHAGVQTGHSLSETEEAGGLNNSGTIEVHVTMPGNAMGGQALMLGGNSLTNSGTLIGEGSDRNAFSYIENTGTIYLKSELMAYNGNQFGEDNLVKGSNDLVAYESATANTVFSRNYWCYYIDDEESPAKTIVITYNPTSTPGGGSKPDPKPTPSKLEPTAPPTIPTDYVAERVAEEEAMEVTIVTIDTTQYSKKEETVVPGTSYNLSKFITTKGIIKGIKTAVAAANKDKKDTIEIYSGKPFCFNKEIIKTIQESKKTVVYYFQYKGHIYSVTVPATVDASKVLEKAGFAGPLYVGQQLGTTKLVK